MMTFAKKIGKALAYLQDTIDIFMGWAFHRLKSLPKQQRKKEHVLQKLTKNTVRFLGQVGDTFYQEYTRLKNRQKK